MPALSDAAPSQAQAAILASRDLDAPDSKTMLAAAQHSENSHGTIAGEGPVAKGLSQGRARKIKVGTSTPSIQRAP